VFVGDYSAQASGDYATGSNHVLPTSGAARARGGLSAADFVRVSTVQRVTQAGLRRIAPAAIALARAEGLAAHAASIEIRVKGTRKRASSRSRWASNPPVRLKPDATRGLKPIHVLAGRRKAQR
jgi:histidinol dehydrogenase